MKRHFDEHPKWNYTEFCTFLLIYSAFADMELSTEEEAMIKSKIDEVRFEEIKAEFEEMSDYDIVQTILTYKGLYFPTLDRKEELLDMIKKEFYADGDFSQMEKNLLRLLKKVM
jgi:hypothetical protein